MVLLEITLTNGWAIAIAILVLIIIWSMNSNNEKLQKQNYEYFKEKTEAGKLLEIEKNDNSNKLNEQALTFKKLESELKVIYQNWAIGEFEKYKKSEVEKIQKEAEVMALKGAQVVLQKWKIENEAKIRQDAINRSYSVNLGKITEHLVPFHQKFLSQFNPKDARFIGSPIDLIVFDGYADKNEDIHIYLVEIKTGNSKLTETQKRIKKAVIEGRIRWAEINPSNDNQTHNSNDPTQTESNNHQGQLDFYNEDFLRKVLSGTKRNKSESEEEQIERVAQTIELAEVLLTEQGYTPVDAINKSIDDTSLVFNSTADRLEFIKGLTEALG